MGYLHCIEISTAFVDHLKNAGPISLNDICKMWSEGYDGERGIPKGSEEEWEWLTMACEYSILHYMSKGLIEPANRGELVSIVQLRSSAKITHKEFKRYLTEASAEDVNRIIGEAVDSMDEYSQWFDLIAWKMTDKAMKRPISLKPVRGVDL